MKIFAENMVVLFWELVAAAGWVRRRAQSFDRRMKFFPRRRRPEGASSLSSPITIPYRSCRRLGWLAFLCRCRQVGS